jgi:hypothetical protein
MQMKCLENREILLTIHFGYTDVERGVLGIYKIDHIFIRARRKTRVVFLVRP